MRLDDNGNNDRRQQQQQPTDDNDGDQWQQLLSRGDLRLFLFILLLLVCFFISFFLYSTNEYLHIDYAYGRQHKLHNDRRRQQQLTDDNSYYSPLSPQGSFRLFFYIIFTLFYYQMYTSRLRVRTSSTNDDGRRLCVQTSLRRRAMSGDGRWWRKRLPPWEGVFMCMSFFQFPSILLTNIYHRYHHRFRRHITLIHYPTTTITNPPLKRGYFLFIATTPTAVATFESLPLAKKAQRFAFFSLFFILLTKFLGGSTQAYTIDKQQQCVGQHNHGTPQRGRWRRGKY